MRPATLAKINALHDEIARLIQQEKQHHDKTHPGENDLWRHVSHAKIEMFANSPAHRAMMVEAVAAFPVVGARKENKR